MVMLNDMDRYHLVIDAIDRTPGLSRTHGPLRQRMEDARLRARQYTREHGEDIPEVADWTWAASVTGSVHQANVGVGQLSVASTGGDNE